MKQATEITDFSQLEPGRYYNVTCSRWNVTNKCQFICDDTTPLKRDITYWQFVRQGFSHFVDKEKLRSAFDKDIMLPNIFAMWSWELNYTTITTID